MQCVSQRDAIRDEGCNIISEDKRPRRCHTDLSTPDLLGGMDKPDAEIGIFGYGIRRRSTLALI